MFPLYHGLGPTILRPYPMEIVDYRLNGTTGNQDILLPESIGKNKTPIAALFVQGHHSATSRVSTGAFDGTSMWCVGSVGINNQSPTKSRHVASTSDVLMLLNPNAKSIAASGVSLIPNGVRVNIHTTYGGTPRGMVALFFDEGGSAKAGTFDPNNSQNGTTLVNAGIAADAVISLGTGDDPFSGTIKDSSLFSLGFACRYDDQASIGHQSRDGVSPSEMSMSIDNQSGAALGGGFSGTAHIKYRSYTATGFSADTIKSAALADNRVGYLALEMPNTNIAAGLYQTPSVTGEDAISTNFPVSSALFGLSQAGINTGTITGADAETAGLGFAACRESPKSITVFGEDGVSPSNAGSVISSTTMEVSRADGSQAISVDRLSPTGDGFKLNFVQAYGSRYWPYLAMGPK